MDFVHDQLFDGRPFRPLTIVDQLSRESPLLEIDFSMSGQKIAQVLDRRLSDGPRPISLTVDHGTELPQSSSKLSRYGVSLARKLQFRVGSDQAELTVPQNSDPVVSFSLGRLPIPRILNE